MECGYLKSVDFVYSLLYTLYYFEPQSKKPNFNKVGTPRVRNRKVHVNHLRAY